MVWTGSFLTNSTYAFLGVDGYLGLGAFAGGGTPGIGVSVPMFDETAPPPSSTTAVLRDPLWQGRVTITGTGLTFGTSPVQGGGMAPVLTGGTVNTLTFEYNETRAFLIEAASSDPNFIPDNYGTEANFLAALASTENAAHLNPNGVINTGGISGAALGAVQTQLFANNDFQAMLDFFSLFGFAFTGSGQENEFVGTENSDSFFSGGGVDFVDGKGGNDFIDGGAGADNLYGGFGNDTVLGGAGDDLFLFGDRLTFTETDARNGNDIVDGGAGNDTAFGGGGNDLLIGGTGNDSLSGDAGNDTLDGGAGEDVLDGGGIITPEFDVASYQSATAGVTVDLNFFPGQPEYQGAGDAFGDIFLRIEGIIGSEFADTILGFNSVPLSDPNATTNDSLIGGGGNDLIQGFSGSDHIAGGTGNDVIVGGNQIAPGPAEVDVLFYTATQAQTTLIGFSNGILVITPTEGMDFVSGVEAFDFNGTRVATQNLNFDPRPTSFGNAGNNTLTLSSGSEIYVGSNGVDSIVALAGDDVLLGGGGFDILSLGAGDDDARGDAGNDSIGGDAGNDRLFGDGGDDTLDGGSGNDRAEGGAGNDLLYGRGGSDVLIGDEGDDQLVGSGGNDLLIGGFGDDILNGGAGIDSHVGGAGIDTLVLLDVSEATVIDFEAGTATFGATTEFFSGIEGVRLGSGNDFVEGTPEANTVDGGAGSDTVSYAGASAAISLDLFQPATNSGEAAGDSITNVETIVGSSFGDTIRGWSSVDILQGRAGNDTLVGRGRVDSLEGAAGDDVLLGGPGDDVLTGGHGADFLRGDAGIDRALFVDAPSAVTVDLVAFDNNTGQATGDRYFLIENVDGSDFHDDLRGDAVDNHLRGRDGNDTLRGRGGDDTLEGGRGADRLLGQGGADLFLFSGPAQGIDTIDDFVSGTDRLGFTSAGFGGLPVGALAPARFTTAGVAGDANDRFIYDTSNGRLFYDSDGTGPAAARLLVVLAGAPTLTAGDLEIV